MKFELLAGFHVDADTTKPKISYVPNVPDEHKMFPDRRYRQGEVFESDKDLCAIFNQEGTPPKFRRVDVYAQEGMVAAPKDGLEELTVKQLNELAEAWEIDLKGNKTKDDVVAILRGYKVTPDPVAV